MNLGRLRVAAAEYAWGQCLFDGAMVEALTGRIRVAGRLTPPISALVVRTAEREWRFDALLDLWRQDAVIGERVWTLQMRNRPCRCGIDPRSVSEYSDSLLAPSA
ncbi:MAG: hypothetical protein EXR77_11185 [Myxococcales bacterium]|nr:hypothetical protein [Myxococcales bacterium]